MSNLLVRFRLRRDISSRWTASNPILAEGEMGYEIDTKKLKIGSSNLNWNSLPYFSTGLSTPSTFFDGGTPTTSYVSGPIFDLGGVN